VPATPQPTSAPSWFAWENLCVSKSVHEAKCVVAAQLKQRPFITI